MSSPPPLSESSITSLSKYNACDISDALLKLKVPGAGFIADLQPYCPNISSTTSKVIIARASTVLFTPKSGDISSYGGSNIPSGSHWVDLTESDTFVVLSQPSGQRNAVLGGIMAARMSRLDAKGVVVGGRIRDIAELKSTGLPVSLICSNFSTKSPTAL